MTVPTHFGERIMFQLPLTSYFCVLLSAPQQMQHIYAHLYKKQNDVLLTDNEEIKEKYQQRTDQNITQHLVLKVNETFFFRSQEKILPAILQTGCSASATIYLLPTPNSVFFLFIEVYQVYATSSTPGHLLQRAFLIHSCFLHRLQ